jgi:hypothetical protein
MMESESALEEDDTMESESALEEDDTIESESALELRECVRREHIPHAHLFMNNTRTNSLLQVKEQPQCPGWWSKHLTLFQSTLVSLPDQQAAHQPAHCWRCDDLKGSSSTSVKRCTYVMFE